MPKVTFDPSNKLIIVNSNIFELDVKADIYSEWKRWAQLGDNSKYLQAISAIGGEQIGAGRFLGSTFFLENGWKIRPHESDHQLTITGNIYTRDGSDITVPTVGDFNITIVLNTSSIVETISTSGGTGGNSGPSAEQIANAVWDRMASAHLNPGSLGFMVSQVNANSELSVQKLLELQAQAEQTKTLVQHLIKYSANKTKIDTVSKTLIIFDDDEVTPIRTFKLLDMLGNPSSTQVYQRVPV